MNVKKCPSSIRRWDSNSQPSDYESPPLTTRPGLQLLVYIAMIITVPAAATNVKFM